MSGEIVLNADGTGQAVFSKAEGAGWTGLGQPIPEAIAKDPKAIAKLCGADYNVVKRTVYFKDTAGNYVEVPNREILVCDDNDEPLEVVSGSRYNLQHAQPINCFEAFRDELAAERMTISHAAVLRGRSIVAVCAKLPDDVSFYVGKKTKNDLIEHYVTLSIGYDRQHGRKATKTSTRVVCANTLAAAIGEAEGKNTIRSYKASQQLEANSLHELIQVVAGLVAQEKALYNKLASHKVSKEKLAEYFANVLQVKRQDGKEDISTRSQNIMQTLMAAYAQAPGQDIAGDTLWGALNAVTYYATHQKGVRDTNGDGEDCTRCASNLFGDAMRMKLRALSLAQEMVAA